MVPPRLYAITAAAAPVAAVIARTSGWFMVARWDLATGAVEPGAWLRGKIYARRCDLSPDGRLLYYFAMKGGKPFHAVSWLPWLTALALWRDNSTYTNGGFFERKADWPDQHPSVVIAVQDAAAAMEEVRRAGGQVLGEPMDIPGVGQYVSFRDPEGNRVSLLQPLPRQG